MMKKTLALTLAVLVLTCGALCAQSITAHRGYWKSEAAKKAQNSIASLSEAQRIGVWGSEFDVQLTADDIPLVNHDADIQGKRISSYPLSTFKAMALSNGEAPSTIEEYLEQGARSPMVLVMELKPQSDSTRENILTDLCLDALRHHQLLNPDRVIFISFSYHICKRLADNLPAGFMVQYLNGDKTPEELYTAGIMGLDYHYSTFQKNPDYIPRAHALGMSVNVWTVDKEETIKEMIALGVDCITTNEPEKVRDILGEDEILCPRTALLGNFDDVPTEQFLNILGSRASVRTFTGEPLDDEQIETMLWAAMCAPTEKNNQPWSFVVVRDPAVKDTLSMNRKEFFESAGAVIVVCGKATVTRRRDGQEPTIEPNPTWMLDCACATENLLLAAHSMGLGAVWLTCWPNETRVQNTSAILGLPEDIVPLAIVPVGHPAKDTAARNKWDPERIHFDTW